VDVIKMERTSDGVAWAIAPCGCAVELLAERGILRGLVDHVIDRTPCKIAENRNATIEKVR
jgi:hypothetical protein